MKICPNQDCPHARRVGRPAEYVDQASCADCGAELVEAEAAVAAAPGRQGRAPLVKIWELHRLYAVDPLRRTLERAEIAVCFRGLYFRSLLCFFGPYVPVDVMVPAPRAEEAHELALELFIPKDEDEVIEAAVPQ